MSSVRKMVISRGNLMILLFASLLMMAFEGMAADIIKEFSVEKECTCTFKGYSEKDNRFALELDCEGKEGYSTDVDLLRKYFKNPQAFSDEKCKLYKSGKVVLKE